MTKLEQAVLKAARRVAKADPCIPGSWASKCENCKARSALEKVVFALDAEKRKAEKLAKA